MISAYYKSLQALYKGVDIPRLDNAISYHYEQGEMNPIFFFKLIEMLDSEKYRSLSKVIWEPFAGHSRSYSIFHDYIEKMGWKYKLIAYDLLPADNRVEQKDATVCCPEENVGAVVFHPPYYGSGAFVDGDSRDIAIISDYSQYKEALRRAVEQVNTCLVVGGLVCAVGASYRCRGIDVRLPALYFDLFNEVSDYCLVQAIDSIVDVGIYLCRLK